MVENLGCEIMKWPIHWEKRTSFSHPLRVDWINHPTVIGDIGITICPGKFQPVSWSGGWNRDLETDVKALSDMGSSLIITLLEEKEMDDLRVSKLGDVIDAHELRWLHFPIPDTTAPTPEFIENLETQKDQIISTLDCGEKIVVHCKGGLERAATLVCIILGWFGVRAGEAIGMVRKSRSLKCINSIQENFLKENCRVNKGPSA